jgi:hypothetical protein
MKKRTLVEQEVTYVDGVIFARDICHRPDGAINRRVEPMIVLWCEAEDDERATHVAFRLVLVCISEEPRNSKFATLNPQSRSFTGRLERHEPAICSADETVRVIGGLDSVARIWFQFPAERREESSQDIEVWV